MASTANFNFYGGATAKAIIRRANRQIRNATTGAWADDTSGNWAASLHTLAAAASGSSHYYVDLSALSGTAIAADDAISVEAHDATGSDPAHGSKPTYSLTGEWTGTDWSEPTEPLDAAGVRGAVGMAAANLDTQLGAIAGYLDTEVAAIKEKTDQITSFDFITAGTRFLTMIETPGAGIYRMTAAALFNVPTSSGGASQQSVDELNRKVASLQR